MKYLQLFIHKCFFVWLYLTISRSSLTNPVLYFFFSYLLIIFFLTPTLQFLTSYVYRPINPQYCFAYPTIFNTCIIMSFHQIFSPYYTCLFIYMYEFSAVYILLVAYWLCESPIKIIKKNISSFKLIWMNC